MFSARPWVSVKHCTQTHTHVLVLSVRMVFALNLSKLALKNNSRNCLNSELCECMPSFTCRKTCVPSVASYKSDSFRRVCVHVCVCVCLYMYKACSLCVQTRAQYEIQQTLFDTLVSWTGGGRLNMLLVSDFFLKFFYEMWSKSWTSHRVKINHDYTSFPPPTNAATAIFLVLYVGVPSRRGLGCVGFLFGPSKATQAPSRLRWFCDVALSWSQHQVRVLKRWSCSQRTPETCIQADVW